MAKAIPLVILFLIETALGAWPRRAHDVAMTSIAIADPLIVGGEVVQGREFPGQVSLQFYGIPICGGSIVASNYILTAAHCSKSPPTHLSVLSGTNQLSEGGTLHQVVEIHNHEKFNATDSRHNDVAVMKVDPPFVFDEGTAPVNLPAQGQVTPAGSNATVIGWGLYTYVEEGSDDLRKVNIIIRDQDKCNDTYRPDGYTVYPGEICAGNPGASKGPCWGDTGGPLFVKGQVVGIFSWHIGCAIPGYPSVYTQVSSYRDWINSKINS